jgi:hypothetical protein
MFGTLNGVSFDPYKPLQVAIAISLCLKPIITLVHAIGNI